MDWLELSVQASPELVEPLVELFQRYGRRQVVVEEAGGFNPDEGESPPTGGPVIVRAYVLEGPPIRRQGGAHSCGGAAHGADQAAIAACRCAR